MHVLIISLLSVRSLLVQFSCAQFFAQSVCVFFYLCLPLYMCLLRLFIYVLACASLSVLACLFVGLSL